MKKKKNFFNKKQLIIFIIASISIVIIFLGYIFLNNSKYLKLKKIGYSFSTISIIVENLDNKAISELLKEEYIDNIDAYISANGFRKENIKRYYEYKQKNTDFDYQKIVSSVNIGLDYEHYTNIENAKTDGYLTLVNKYRKLSENYIPGNLELVSDDYSTKEVKLVKAARDAFEKMCEDAKKEKLTILAYSGYRSYHYQTYTYNTYLKRLGLEKTDLISARSGHSEHQLGLAVDVTNKALEKNHFENTKEYEWLIENAYKYGFILRYQENKEDIQQYSFEPWHYRYVGEKTAKDMHDNYSSLTYDEYYLNILKKS